MNNVVLLLTVLSKVHDYGLNSLIKDLMTSLIKRHTGTGKQIEFIACFIPS